MRALGGAVPTPGPEGSPDFVKHLTVAAALGVLLVPSAALLREHQRTELESKLADVSRVLEASHRGAGFSGVVLIAQGDDVVLNEAYGFADVEHRVPMRTDHVLRIGSLTKPITASAVMAAVDRGLLSLDAELCGFLAPCPPSWGEVTLRHLLSHSSGITDHFGELESVPVEATVDELRRVLTTLAPDEALRSPPGAEYAYSNFNYVLVGAVLESATGMPWEAALEQLVFEPLRLGTLAYDDVYAIVPNRARGYARDDELRLRNIDYDDHAAYAAGGLLASAGDLFRWSRGMLGAELFDAELVRASLTPHLGDYGLGWQVRRFFDRPIYNHTGGIDGFSSHLAHYPEQDLTIIVLSNVENDSAILRACDVAARLFEWRVVSDAAAPEPTPRQRCGLE